MSRSGYSDDCDSELLWINWRGCVASASRGKRGQKFFRDLLAALDAMPVKRLIADKLETPEGEVCALGALGKARGTPMADIDEAWEEDGGVDGETLGDRFDIDRHLALETVYVNDERLSHLTPERRWEQVRAWAAKQIVLTPEEVGQHTQEAANA